MKIKALLNKNKYSFFVFAVLCMLCLIYGDFESAFLLICKLFLCGTVSLFFAPFLSDEKSGRENVFLCAFSLLSVISCNAIFLTKDIHILLSLSCFFIALIFEKRFKYLTPVFAGLCVLSQPLTLLFFAPAIIISLAAKKEKLLSVLTAVISVATFALTKAFKAAEFFADQFSSYYLSVHLFYLSNEHLKMLAQFALCSIPLLIIFAIYLVRLFLNKKRLSAALVLCSAFLSIFAFALSKNTTTVFMILIPIFALMLSLKPEDGFKEAASKISEFFGRHLLLFLLSIAWVAAYPLTLGSYPYSSELFSKATFIIFRQE